MGQVANIFPNLKDQNQFRLSKTNEIKEYFIVDIRDRELTSKRLSKHIASFDYFDKYLVGFLQQIVALLLHYFILLLVHLQEQQLQVLVLHF